MIITIDGPAGSGKSTAARKLAARLEIAYLDTGAMYRAVAYAALQQNADFQDAGQLLAVAKKIRLELDCGPTHTRVRVDGRDVSEAIRSMAVSGVISTVARLQGIRDLLVEQQRKIGQALVSFVSEGRDQGSVVFPGANAKFVLIASLDKRAERRQDQLAADGEEVPIETVMENLRARDGVDQQQWDPLLQTGEAIILDTSHISLLQVVERMQEILGARRLI